MRRRLPTLLLVFALPAGLVGYAVGVWLVRAIFGDAADGILLLFVPLFLGGLAMVPFVLPFIDRRAKADLAAIRALHAADGGVPDGAAPPPDAGAPTESRERP
jgi:hypothetical protein